MPQTSGPSRWAGWPVYRTTVLAVAVAVAGLLAPVPWGPGLALAVLAALVVQQAVAGARWAGHATVVAARLAQGDYETLEPEAGPAYARRFARSINRAARENAGRARALHAALADAARQRDRLDSIFTASSDGLLLYDVHRHIVAANPRVGELLGFTAEELATRSAEALGADLGARSADPALYQAHLEAHFTAPALPHEDVLIVERPRRRVLKRLSSPVLHDGHVAGRVFTYTDITAEWDVDHMKSEFVATASHELRTPLTAIHAALQLVAATGSDALEPEDREMLGISLANTERLVRLVNDLLDLSKITADRMPMTFELLPLAPLLEEAVRAMRAFADERNIRLRAQAVGPCLAEFDRHHLPRVLANLTSNAIKYSPPGSTVTLSALVAGDAEISVADEGPGIEADQVPRLFRPFSRVGAQERQITGGTGLGLAISRAIVEQHGGRIWWEPNAPTGSRFVFTLPAAARGAASAPAA